MRTTRTRIGTLCAAALLALGIGVAGERLEARGAAHAAAAGGQDPAAPPPGRANRPQPPDASTVPTGELVNMLDTYAIVQAQQALSLDDEKYGPFVTRLKRLQEARRRNQRERNQILQDLRRLAGAQAATPVDEGAVRERLRALRDHDERAAAEMRKAYDAVDEVLDVRQQARFRLFEETIERRKLDLLMRARERAARGNGTASR
jgi:hypothetical protein